MSYTLRQVRTAIIDMINFPPEKGQYEVPYIEGDPGIGKTSMMRSIYEEMSRKTISFKDDKGNAQTKLVNPDGFTHFIEYVAPEHEPTDFMMPFPNGDRSAVSMLPCEDFKFGENDRVFFFIDEIDKCPNMMQNILGRIGNDRRVGNFILPRGSFVAMAGNKLSNKAGGMVANTHIKNRRVHMPAIQTAGDWIEDVAIPFDLHDSVVSYIRTDHDILHKFDAAAPTFPSPRTWTKVGLILNHKMDNTIESMRIAGHVGEEAKNTFWGHLKIFRSLRPVEEIVANPKGCKVPEGKDAPAILYAEVTSLARHAAAGGVDRHSIQTANAICTYFGRIPGEFAFCGYKDFLQRNRSLLVKCGEAQPWLAKNAAILKATQAKKE